MTTDRVMFEIEVDIHIFAESAGVVISISFGIPETFKYTVGLEQNIFDSKKNILCEIDQLGDVIHTFMTDSFHPV